MSLKDAVLIFTGRFSTSTPSLPVDTIYIVLVVANNLIHPNTTDKITWSSSGKEPHEPPHLPGLIKLSASCSSAVFAFPRQLNQTDKKSLMIPVYKPLSGIQMNYHALQAMICVQYTCTIIHEKHAFKQKQKCTTLLKRIPQI